MGDAVLNMIDDGGDGPLVGFVLAMLALLLLLMA